MSTSDKCIGGTCVCSWRAVTATTIDGKWPPPHEPHCPLSILGSSDATVVVAEQRGTRHAVEKAIADSKKPGTWDELLKEPDR